MFDPKAHFLYTYINIAVLVSYIRGLYCVNKLNKNYQLTEYKLSIIFCFSTESKW